MSLPKIDLNNIVSVNGQFTFFPSGSILNPTSSNASTAAQVDILVTSDLPENFVSDTTLNPYIQIPIISGSNSSSGIDRHLVIRFYSQSHIQTKNTSSVEELGTITGYVLAASESLYLTASSTDQFLFRDVLYNRGDNEGTIRNKIFNAISSSAFHRSGMISASLGSNISASVSYNSASIHYVSARHAVPLPIIFTGSFSTLSSSLVLNSVSTGSGNIVNFAEDFTISNASASLSIGHDTLDPLSFVFSVGTSSLGYTNSGGTGNRTPFYISSSGKLGFNTKEPLTDIDLRADELQIQGKTERRGLKINTEGNIESFDRNSATSATGSEFILKYSRGISITDDFVNEVFGTSFSSDSDARDFFNALENDEQTSGLRRGELLGFINPAQTGDTLGAIRWVAESGSIGDLNERTAGETAVIKAVVSDADSTGTQADLIFSVAGKTGAATQMMLLDANGNHEITGSLDISTGMIIGNTISHKGDDDTSINFTDDNISLEAGSQIVFQVQPSQVTIGDGGIVNLQVRTDGDNNTLFVKGSDDKVGIGTNTPGEKLEVIGNISASGTIFSETAKFGSGTVIISGSAGNITASGNVSASGFISASFFSGDGSGLTNVTATATVPTGTISGSDHIFTAITASGNISASGTGSFSAIGIGTNNPDSDIEIESTNAHAQINIDSARDASLILDKGATTRRAAIIYKTAGTNNWFVGSADSDVVGSGDDYFIGKQVGGTDAEFFISSSGNVGIGTITPEEKLHVVGNVRIASSDPNLRIEDTNGRSVEIDVTDDIFRIDDVGNNAAIFTTDLSTNPTQTTFQTRPTFLRDAVFEGNISASGTITALSSNIVTIDGGSF